jgi:hypothetical protein
MVIVAIFYIIPEMEAAFKGIGTVNITTIGLISSYLLYALVFFSLFCLPLLLGHLAASGLNLSLVPGLPLPARWQLMCLASTLPTLGTIKICIDATQLMFTPPSYSVAIVLVHVIAAMLQILVVMLAGSLITISTHSCQAHGSDIMHLTAASCRAAAQQQMAINMLLGPFYLFYFGVTCFALMFYTFDIYVVVGSLNAYSAGLLIYTATALGMGAMLHDVILTIIYCYFCRHKTKTKNLCCP